MRTIIFRAKSTETSKWVYGDLRQGFMGTKIIEDFDTPPTMSDPCGGIETLYHAVDSETVGQFTGLYDNTKWDELTYEEQIEFIERYHLHPEDWKGKEIYEGDILGFTTKKETGYRKDGIKIALPVVFGICNPDNDVLSEYIGFWVEKGLNYRGSISYEVGCNGAKIIGNVHDNPELINS